MGNSSNTENLDPHGSTEYNDTSRLPKSTGYRRRLRFDEGNALEKLLEPDRKLYKCVDNNAKKLVNNKYVKIKNFYMTAAIQPRKSDLAVWDIQKVLIDPDIILNLCTERVARLWRWSLPTKTECDSWDT